ncbi:MAG: carbohydrate-binding domain-containing protein, partial [Clostridiales bacterium]|nr:carbohydrate-binding domain-containing protein [Clostridiales bacterium]
MKKLKQNRLKVILRLFIACALASLSAVAVVTYLSELGAVDATETIGIIEYDWNTHSGDITISESGAYTLTGNTNTYGVTITGGDIAITLNGVNMQTAKSPIVIQSGAAVMLTLLDNNTLRCIDAEGAGLQVNNGAAL